jgi:hypothetical protein
VSKYSGKYSDRDRQSDRYWNAVKNSASEIRENWNNEQCVSVGVEWSAFTSNNYDSVQHHFTGSDIQLVLV